MRKTFWCRPFLRRYGAVGVVVVGCYLLALHCFATTKRRRLLSVLSIVLASLLAFGLYAGWVGEDSLRRGYPNFGVDANVHPLGRRLATYTITDLGALPGGSSSRASALNERGQIVGWSKTGKETEEGDPIYHGFLWENGTLRDIGSLKNCSFARSINAQGQITGTSYLSEEQCFAFLWQDGKMQNLGSLGGQHPFSWSGGINDQGQVAGTSSASDAPLHAFLWQKGEMHMLFPPKKGMASYASAINNAGDVVGAISYNEHHYEAYYLHEGHVTPIQPPAGEFVWPSTLNKRGQVVGISDVAESSEYVHAFFWQPGDKAARDLGTLGGAESFADGLNDNGDIVGEAERTDGRFHAVWWRDNNVIDLNTLLPRDSGWLLTGASAINNQGWIVGGGLHNGHIHAYLLKPTGS